MCHSREGQNSVESPLSRGVARSAGVCLCHSREGGNPEYPVISFFTHGPERSAQRNYGLIEKAQGEYEMFVDADMTLSSDLIKNCVEFIKKENCVALHISEIVMGNNFWSKVRRFERSFYDGTVIDGARFFKKETFVKVGGFDETMSRSADDPLLTMTLCFWWM